MNLIELHMLQSFPVSCLNRDDVGAPKSAVFGGCRRARVSSQCWKRAIRLYMQDELPEQACSFRTRYVVDLIADALREREVPEDNARELAASVAAHLNDIDSRDKRRVKTALLLSPQEVTGIAENLLHAMEADANKVDVKKVCRGVTTKDAADIAVFGRMVANDHTLMIEGAGLFSHALSTHQSDNELDFFAAVDEKPPPDATGAAITDTLEFNSACYYRYVGLNLDLLAENLGQAFSAEECTQVTRAFLRASLMAMPAARKNSMFGLNPPEHVFALRRSGQPLSLVNAFERPVRANGGGYLDESAARMQGQWEKLKKLYGIEVSVEAALPPDSLDELLAKLV